MTNRITDAQINHFRRDAAAAGDEAAVGNCDRALAGYAADIDWVADAIAEQAPRGIRIGGQVAVRDPSGEVWWPDDSAEDEIIASDDQLETAERICRTQPQRGRWSA